uniref:Large ribosomal subunit protein uL18c n=1 Tax=Platysiphonia delicata TaxID=2006979 RepID=A0A1Z1M179_9FLOR|nr:ribosomal protein L18 [Platysiphonia delicata]ARW59642.1 ribosomal protein L18 [Platysiphonia delicata]
MKQKIRKMQIKGTSTKPRLYVLKSNKHIYAQIINDEKSHVLTSISSNSKNINKFANCEIAKIVGKNIGKELKNRKISKIIFDCGKHSYHGQIKALANATREEGIKF